MRNTPHLREIDYESNSERYFKKLRPLGKRVWLDSGRPFSDAGRFDILCAEPNTVFINPHPDVLQRTQDAYRQEWQAQTSDHSTPLPFCGGIIGCFNYEYNINKYKVKGHQSARPSVFASFDWALVQDHVAKKSYLVFHPRCTKASELVDLLKHRSDSLVSECFSVENLRRDLPQEKYFDALAKIKHHIIQGNTYQINFSQRFSASFSGSPEAAYLALRAHMPSPFSAYLEIGDDIIMSFSPERFIEINENLARTQPIKGTAPRGNSQIEDTRLAQELYSSEKNRAENLMIVDLLRNDFSKSCEPFSVKTSTLFELQSFANVHHLVSTVEGKLNSNISQLEFFLRCFPGGSITGAPKKRAMEIIRSLETEPRNAYCGSICYMSACGKLDSNIAIRTLLLSLGKIYCWGGGGIVFDSKAEDEYQESIQKVAVLIEVLRGEEPQAERTPSTNKKTLNR